MSGCVRTRLLPVRRSEDGEVAVPFFRFLLSPHGGRAHAIAGKSNNYSPSAEIFPAIFFARWSILLRGAGKNRISCPQARPGMPHFVLSTPFGISPGRPGNFSQANGRKIPRTRDSPGRMRPEAATAEFAGENPVRAALPPRVGEYQAVEEGMSDCLPEPPTSP